MCVHTVAYLLSAMLLLLEMRQCFDCQQLTLSFLLFIHFHLFSLESKVENNKKKKKQNFIPRLSSHLFFFLSFLHDASECNKLLLDVDCS